MSKIKRLNKKALQRLDKKYLWHPFTQMSEWLKEDFIIISHGKGNYLYDIDGKKYLDGVSSIWCNLHGHSKKELNNALKRQADRISHSTFLGLSNIPAILLAERLTDLAPEGLTRVFYSDNGSTAVEVALKMSLQYWQHRGMLNKQKFISLKNGYHGDTIGAMSTGGIELFTTAFRSMLFHTLKAPSPYCYRCELNLSYPACNLRCADEVDLIAREYTGEIAALIIEPMVQAAGGFIVSPPGYLRKIADICRKHSILLIADEIATGFMRTGMMFAVEHEGVIPDIMCLSKGLTGGYLPLAATLTTEDIFSAFLGRYEDFKTFFHGHTYTGNPLGCSVALASIGLLTGKRQVKSVQNKIKFFKEALSGFVHLEHVGEVRQLGLMIGIELVRDKITREPYPLEERMGWKVCNFLRKEGIFLRPLGNTIVLMPPLSIQKSEIDTLISLTYRAIKAVTP